MNANGGREEMGDRGSQAAINEFNRDGLGLGEGVQTMGEEDCRINEGAGSSGVDQRQQRDGELARNDQVNAEGQVARGGMRERNGGGKSTAQPDPYC